MTQLRDTIRFGALVALVATAACDNDAHIELSITEFGLVTSDLYRISVTDGRRTWNFAGTEVAAGSTRVATATRGTLTVSYRLMDGVAGELGRGSIELELKPDWFWTVSFMPRDRDPTEGCFGCLRHVVFPLAEQLRTSPSDSMHVVIGGNYISDPVVY